MSDEVTRVRRVYFSIIKGMSVYSYAIRIAQDGVLHRLDPGRNRRNGTFVPYNIMEMSTNVPNFLHDVLGSIGNFVPDR